jgi:hypothetical protein
LQEKQVRAHLNSLERCSGRARTTGLHRASSTKLKRHHRAETKKLEVKELMLQCSGLLTTSSTIGSNFRKCNPSISSLLDKSHGCLQASLMLPSIATHLSLEKKGTSFALSLRESNIPVRLSPRVSTKLMRKLKSKSSPRSLPSPAPMSSRASRCGHMLSQFS